MGTQPEHDHVVSAAHLAENLSTPDLRIVDCRFALDDPERGRRDYHQTHLPGAVYAHLDEDLSAPIHPGKTGRHPLPDIRKLGETFSQMGIDAKSWVVAYDDATSTIAARLWWLLRWLGHDRVSVLDGGWRGWMDGGYAVSQQQETIAPRHFIPSPRQDWVAQAEDVERLRRDSRYRLIDARGNDRFRGEVEPIDAKAGHIPGAINAPAAENVDAKGHLLPKSQLAARYQALLQNIDTPHVIAYCGSGVTACHNLLAMAHAGLGDGKLYPGSWSEWITDPSRPIAP